METETVNITRSTLVAVRIRNQMNFQQITIAEIFTFVQN